MRKKTGAYEWGGTMITIADGCGNGGCRYCVDGNTLILMADGSSKMIKDLKKGDGVLGFKLRNGLKKYANAEIVDVWSTKKTAYKVTMANKQVIICSGEHRWLTTRGWKYTYGKMYGAERRPHLTEHKKILWVGAASQFSFTNKYEMGYLYGVIRGDGTIGKYDYSGRRRNYDKIYSFSLAMKDWPAVKRCKYYLVNQFGITTHRFNFKMKDRKGILHNELSIRTNCKKDVICIEKFCHSPFQGREFYRGFIAGFFDAEGSANCVIRLHNQNLKLLKRVTTGLLMFGFVSVLEKNNKHCWCVRIKGGIPEIVRFFQTFQPAIKRKFLIQGKQLRHAHKVEKIECLNSKRKMFDITTTTGNFVANGFVAHNCYAREMARRYGRNIIENWPNVKVRQKEVDRPRPLYEHQPVFFQSASDITPSILSECLCVLRKILDAGNNVLIVSKPHWSCISIICETFQEYKEQIIFRFTIGSINDDILRFWEPGAPNFAMRHACLIYAHQFGYKTSVSCEPYLSDPKEVYDKLIEHITESFWIGKLNKFNKRVNTNGLSDVEMLKYVWPLKAMITDYSVRKIYSAMKNLPLVKFKDSIREIVGIE